jgi:hypothetical protein
MSRRKIKDPARKRKAKIPKLSVSQIMKQSLAVQRDEKRTQDATVIGDMIADDKINCERIDEHKYIKNLANELGWTVGRTNKAINDTHVREVIRENRKVS